MPKAKPLDRLELTRRKMEARERMKVNAEAVISQEYTKENSPFLKMREQWKQKELEAFIDEEHSCPVCGGELVRFEGCYRCKNCGWSKC